MADFLIRHLEQKCSEHSVLQMLVNQWGFDKQLIPKALQTVGNMFPHYSRHDESHSKQILVNVERLLGNNVSLLSATDTWLILEAAYWHDIGMVVPRKDIEEAVNDKGFQQYVQSIRDNPRHELNRFCKSFAGSDLSVCFLGADTPWDAVERFRQLLAEWFRRTHPGRAEEIVELPWERSGISSPRTELIPNRLFRLLGRICYMHGSTFSELMSDEGLPFKEAGLAREDCHPRFVACLLRLGDLLDLDDNRFCPVMQRISGEQRPHLTRAHEDKHSSLRHLRLDPERIEVTAECETIDGYLETFKWFDWLKKEMQDQVMSWQDIAPTRELGLLPTLGEPIVRLKGLEILTPGERPQFRVDGAKAIELLRGNNLYTSKFDCVRELLQNAVDATLVRLWIDDPDMEKWANPYSDIARTVLQQKSIMVDLQELENKNSSGTLMSSWRLTIVDQGTGISLADLQFMTRVGGSQANSFRQIRIAAMPEWMKPSGAFGIGFQSVFMISEQAIVTTRSIFSNDNLKIVFHSPMGQKEGLVLVETLRSDGRLNFGTKIEVCFETERIPSSFTTNYKDQNSIAYSFLREYDPVLDTNLPYEAARLADHVADFGKGSFIAVTGNLRVLNGGKAYDLSSRVTERDGERTWHLIKAGEHLFGLRYELTAIFSSHNNVIARYRGQPFEYKRFFPFARIEVDILSGKAGSWLSINRKQLEVNSEKVLVEAISKAFLLAIKKDLPAIRSEGLNSQMPLYSLFLHAMALWERDEWQEVAKQDGGDAWLALSLPEKPDVTFRQIFQRDSWILAERGSGMDLPIDEYDALIDETFPAVLRTMILSAWKDAGKGSVQVIGPTNFTAPSDGPFPHNSSRKNYMLRYKLMSEPQPPYNNAALAARLAELAMSSGHNRRVVLYCNDIQWESLALEPTQRLWVGEVFPAYQTHLQAILLPFLFNGHDNTVLASPDQLHDLCAWVRPRSLRQRSLAEIRDAYDRLTREIETIMLSSHFADKWTEHRRPR